MPELTLRDRLYTRRVGTAMTSPLGIVLFGAGTAAAVLVGLPLVVAPLVGLGAWAARVAAAMPRGFDADGIDPFDLDDPWRTSVWQAKRSRRNYEEAVRGAKDGPLQDRLTELGRRITTMIEECWEAAQGGDALSKARARIDVADITHRLATVQAQRGGAPALDTTIAQTIESLESQLAAAKRMDEVIADTVGRLQLLNARLDEAVTRAVELSVRARSVEDLSDLTTDIDDLVTEMESLRQTLTESGSETAAYDAAVRAAQPPPPVALGPTTSDPLLDAASAPPPEQAPAERPMSYPPPPGRTDPLPNQPWPATGEPPQPGST